MKLPWENEVQIEKIAEEWGGGYKAYIEVLGPDRCYGDGETRGEAVDDLFDNSLETVLADYARNGVDPPLPAKKPNYSGNIYVRTARSIHQRVARRAKKEGVSINHLMSVYIVQGLDNQCAEETLKCIQEQTSNFWKVMVTSRTGYVEEEQESSSQDGDLAVIA